MLAEGAAAFPSPNPGLSFFQPYYQGYTTGSDTTIQGYFDYRPKDQAEAIVAARSTDGGRTWTFQSQALSYSPPAASSNDDGEGHPYVIIIGGHTYLYTLDRAPASVDNLGLLVRSISPSGGDPLAGAPSVATPGTATGQRTVGLTQPDGIIDVVPGSANPTRLLYLQKNASSTPNVVTVHLAETTDGITFTNDQVVGGLVSSSLPFIGPRGTLVRYADGHYGLFFSAGLTGEDADAFHFIGYAESNDLLSWAMVNDVDHPLLSTDAAKDPTGGQPWYAGRLYAPSVGFSADGCTGTMVFSAYKAVKPKDSINDYRQVGVVTLSRCSAGVDGGGGTTSGGTTAGTGGTTSGGTTSGGTTSGTGSTATSGGTTAGTSGTTAGTGGTTSGTGSTATSGGTTTGTRTTSGGCDLVSGHSADPLACCVCLLLLGAIRWRATARRARPPWSARAVSARAGWTSAHRSPRSPGRSAPAEARSR